MGESTPEADLIYTVTWPSLFSALYNGSDDLSMFTISGFNVSNLSRAGPYMEDEDVERRSVGEDSAGGISPLNWEDLWRGVPLGIILACLCLLTTVGNILVLHAVRTEKRLQTVSNLFIVSLAVADVIVGIIVMPMSAFYIFTERWMLGVAVCQIWMGVDYTASTASILNLFILSLDRYWSVRQPLKYLHKRTKRRALSMIAFVWAVSSLWIIPISSWHYFAHSGNRTVPSDNCDTEYAKNSFFKIIAAFFNFYLPLTVMYILYIRIFIAIRKRSEFELGQRNPGGTTLAYKSNVPDSHSNDESECNDKLPCSMEQRLGAVARARENGTRSNIPSSGRNLRIVTTKRRQLPPTFKAANSTAYKVEYIYDENVVDPQTEKIERYYYEDNCSETCLSRSGWLIGNERFSMTNQRAGLQRSPRQLGDFKMSPKFSSTTSLTNCSFKSNGPCFVEHSHLQHKNTTGTKHSVVVSRSLARSQKKSHRSGMKRGNSVRIDNHKQLEAEMSITPSLCRESTQTTSSSSSSSTSTYEDSRCDEGGRRACKDRDIRGARDTAVGSACRKPEASRRVSRAKFSALGAARNVRQDESFLDKTSPISVDFSSSIDSSAPRNDDLDIMNGDENASFSVGKTNLKERLATIRQSSSLNKEIKAAKQLGVIMGAFTLCFLPYFILFLVVAFCDNCVGPGHLTAATWVGYLNSTLNPFLYPLCNANFRSKFRAMLACSSQSRSPLRVTQTECQERNTAFHPRYD